jgi:cyclopropane fatty-acyl-phospholipid synthase-like methyltransferase
VPQWRASFLPRFAWQGKRVVEYGIGGGYLGRLLYREYGIAGYVGVDISQRALAKAAEVLKAWERSTQLLLTPQTFRDLRPELFVSQQVIQHFPALSYLKDFLRNVDASGAQELMLHIRQTATGETKENDDYSKGEKPNFAILTNLEFLREHLPSYALLWNGTQPMCCDTVGVYSGWRLVR